MTFDKEDVKERISLRELFERDWHFLKRAGLALACRCPMHAEKTSSCVVHEKEKFFKCFGCDFKGDCFDYWEKTRGVEFKAALEELAGIAGVFGSVAPVVATPPAKSAKPALEDLAPALDDETACMWLGATHAMRDDATEQRRIADWRGYSVETVRWAAEHRLLGSADFMGARREAFLVERPSGDSPISVGWHIRLGPNTPGNWHAKASWRYPWAGIGSWPFLIGSVANARTLFLLEGQWDALVA